MTRVFANDPGDWGSIQGQGNKVKIKGQVEQSMEWSSTLP